MNECSESTNRRIDNRQSNRQRKRVGNDPTKTRRDSKQQKGDPRIRKPFDASLSDSYLEPKLTLFISIRSTYSSPFVVPISFITIRSESTTESENGLSTGIVRVKDATTVVNNRVTR